MRLFFALPLPEPLRSALADWQERAKETGLTAAFPRREGLHLTLVFLGTVAADKCSLLEATAARVALKHGPIPLVTGGFGAFPHQGAPKVIWLGLEASNPLLALQDELALAVEPLGFPAEERPFLPHLTLARPRGKGSETQLPEGPGPLRWTARELVLYESLSAVGGQRYEARGRWALSGSAPLR